MAKKVTKTPEGATKKTSTTRRRASGAKSRTAAAETVTKSADMEAIRARAYEIFASGRNPNNPVADWLEAERELASAGA